jgi:addiction module HigA family antidote
MLLGWAVYRYRHLKLFISRLFGRLYRVSIHEQIAVQCLSYPTNKINFSIKYSLIARVSEQKVPSKNNKSRRNPSAKKTTNSAANAQANSAAMPTKPSAKHPGEVLRENFMTPIGLTASHLSQLLHLGRARVNEIINGQRGVTAETALRLARLFSTTPRFWLDLQSEYELSEAEEKFSSIIAGEIEPIGVTGARSLVEARKMSDKRKSVGEKFSGKTNSNGAQKSLAETNLRAKQNEQREDALAALTADQKRLYNLISIEPIHFDILFVTAGFGVRQLGAELTMLELAGLIEQQFGSYFKRVE